MLFLCCHSDLLACSLVFCECLSPRFTRSPLTPEMALLPTVPAARWSSAVSFSGGGDGLFRMFLRSLAGAWRATRLLYAQPLARDLDWRPRLVASCPPTIAVILGILHFPCRQMHGSLHYWCVVWLSRRRNGGRSGLWRLKFPADFRDYWTLVS
jgi:hypothetical protein